jgi:hypothetical protein
MSFTLQTSVDTNAPVAIAGMHADDGIKDTISRKLLGTVLAGLYVCGDQSTCEPPDAAADVTGHGLGIVQYDASAPPSSTGYADGACVSVGRMGRFWGTLLSGAAPTDGAAVYVYRGATAADRGKFTQDSGAGSVTRVEGAKFTGRLDTGVAEIQFDGIGVPGDGVDVVASELASNSHGQGASLVGIEDAGSFTAATTQEDANAEIFQQLYSAQRDVPVNLASGMLAAGTPLAAFTDNAGASAPGITLADSKAVAVRWNNQGTQTAVWYKAHFPQNIDDAADIIAHFAVSKSGATVGDATKITMTAFVNAPGSLHDADTDFGGDSSALVGNAAAKTISELTLTLGNADIPAAPFSISFSIKPKDGTLGTDDCIVHDVWFEIKSKKVTS